MTRGRWAFGWWGICCRRTKGSFWTANSTFGECSFFAGLLPVAVNLRLVGGAGSYQEDIPQNVAELAYKVNFGQAFP